MTPTQIALGLAAFQAAMVARNLTLYTHPRQLNPRQSFDDGVSVLIPARNEEKNLGKLLSSLLNQVDCRFEIVVLDDNSEDSTYSIAESFAENDRRVRVVRSRPLPDGWAGKQFACHQLSQEARFDHWIFVDSDVVFTDAQALARMAFHLKSSSAGMLSSVPRQLTGTWAEQLIIPIIHQVLLGFLPFWEMRRNCMPALGAACGQLVAVKRQAYHQSGGHEGVKHRLHDATALATLMREKGILTDLFDSTELASCRMYHNSRDVFLGFAKNATEGMAQPALLPLWTVLLLGANVWPWACGFLQGWTWELILAVILNLSVFGVLMRRYRHSWLGAVARPAGVLTFVAIQWIALIGKWVGWRATWKGRSYERLYK